jgi:hypothetical protein
MPAIAKAEMPKIRFIVVSGPNVGLAGLWRGGVVVSGEDVSTVGVSDWDRRSLLWVGRYMLGTRLLADFKFRRGLRFGRSRKVRSWFRYSDQHSPKTIQKWVGVGEKQQSQLLIPGEIAYDVSANQNSIPPLAYFRTWAPLVDEWTRLKGDVRMREVYRRSRGE